ncbi:hypothetical protein D3C72_1765360 [compost metagenome]
MELHALDRQRLVAHAHDLAVVGPGGDLQAFRQRLALDHQRMVAGAGHRVGDVAEHADIVVRHRRHLAVHQLLGVDDLAAKGLADALVAETDAHDRQLAGEVVDGRHRDAGFVRRARAGRQHQVLRRQRLDFFQRDFVVAEDLDFLPQLAEVLHEVVGEGIVVVDHQ